MIHYIGQPQGLPLLYLSQQREHMRIIIISGRSGSGKSAALNMLEDLNYYCVDNLPIDLLFPLFQTLEGEHDNIAISVDARNIPNRIEEFSQVIHALKTKKNDFQIIYLDADDSTLLKRFSETQRRHPLQKSNLIEAIEEEKKLLEPIANLADLQIDTTHLTVRKLREIIHSRIEKNPTQTISLTFQSFGYKYGIPVDTDFAFDIRCLPNPYWEKHLREKTGVDEAVIEYLESYPQVQEMFQQIKTFLQNWLPIFKKENRKYLTVSIGCTGGQHRSVYLVEKLGKHFSALEKNVLIRHRELV
jgi:UPF0042 nucleotide-binding protein